VVVQRNAVEKGVPPRGVGILELPDERLVPGDTSLQSRNICMRDRPPTAILCAKLAGGFVIDAVRARLLAVALDLCWAVTS
jgi:hypothetical protein